MRWRCGPRTSAFALMWTRTLAGSAPFYAQLGEASFNAQFGDTPFNAQLGVASFNAQFGDRSVLRPARRCKDRWPTRTTVLTTVRRPASSHDGASAAARRPAASPKGERTGCRCVHRIDPFPGPRLCGRWYPAGAASLARHPVLGHGLRPAGSPPRKPGQWPPTSGRHGGGPRPPPRTSSRSETFVHSPVDWMFPSSPAVFLKASGAKRRRTFITSPGDWIYPVRLRYF